jgi:hydrogenase/urease accessory protein HupE
VGHRWGIQPVVQVLSNLVGLQFLAVDEETRALSVLDLVTSRLALSETIVIPLTFTLGAIVAFRTPTRRHVAVLVAFGFYVGLVTLTDFNSFRQNIPFMPTFGMLVVLEWHARKSAKRPATPLVGTSG